MQELTHKDLEVIIDALNGRKTHGLEESIERAETWIESERISRMQQKTENPKAIEWMTRLINVGCSQSEVDAICCAIGCDGFDRANPLTQQRVIEVFDGWLTHKEQEMQTC